MAVNLQSRVWETVSSAPGTGAATPGGALPGFRTITSALSTGDYATYTMRAGSLWETGLGKWDGSAWQRVCPIDGSSGAATLVNFSAAPVNLFLDRLADGMETLVFGDGSDGALTTSSGTTTFADDKAYSDVTISGTAIVAATSYRMFVAGLLDLTNAPAGAIHRNGSAGNNATSSVGSSAKSGLGANTLGGSTAGGGGGAGGTTTGSTGAAGTAGSPANGGSGGSGGATNGKGGAGSSGAGANGSAAGAVIFPARFGSLRLDLLRGSSLVIGGCGGGGGGGGGGDGTNSGAGAGGGANGAGVLFVAARAIKRDSSTTVAGAIQAIGGTGGTPSTPSVGNVGGGGGGQGGGGGYIYLVYLDLIGTAKTGLIDASGGTGGAGGPGFGTGTAGNGGGGGSGGGITAVNIRAGTVTSVAAGTAGSGPTGTTGGAGGASTMTL